jgi:hypothetical protein
VSVDVVDGPPLVSGFWHRHAAGDLQTVRVIGDRRVSISSLKARLGDLLNRRITVAPFGVHLQIAAVIVER